MTVERSACPICRKPAVDGTPWFPFCGDRCRTEDLANWATGTYSVPVHANESDENWDAPPDDDEGGDDE